MRRRSRFRNSVHLAYTAMFCIVGCRPSDETPVGPSFAVATPEDTVARYIVTLRPDLPGVDDSVASISRRYGQRIHHIYRYALKGFAADLTPAAAKALARHPQLASIERDRPAFQHAGGTDYTSGWGVGRIDQRSGPSDYRFSYGTTGTGVNIYIVDGGVVATHPDFGGRVRTAWTWDARYPAGQDCSGHGTAVASVAAGNEYGVAKGATIWSVRANDCDDWSWSSTLEAGIDWVTGHHIKPAVLNFSYGAASFWDGLAPGSMHDAVIRAKSAGVFVVVSAGNNNGDACGQSPSNAREVMTVAASSENDQRSAFSNYGSCVDIFAPGDAINVASHLGGYAVRSGTSFSAPMVAGVAALLYEKYPADSPDQIHYGIIHGGTESVIGNPGPSSPNLLLYSSLPAPVRASIVGRSSVGRQMTCTWYADVRAGRGPFQYLWSGVLSGSTSGVSGRVMGSGWLNLEVRDVLGGYSSRSLYVSVDPANTAIWCP